MSNEYNFKIDPKETALIVIDMQNGFLHDEGGLARGGVNIENQKAIIPTVKELVRLAHDEGIQVLWSKQVHYPDDATKKTHKIPMHHQKRGTITCMKGTFEVDIHKDLEPEVKPEDIIFTKHRSSCFFDTTLQTKLRMLGIKMLIIAGVNTNFCVDSTVRDAYFRDYDIIVMEDGVACSYDDMQKAILKNVRIFFGAVMNIDELRNMLQKNKE